VEKVGEGGGGPTPLELKRGKWEAGKDGFVGKRFEFVKKHAKPRCDIAEKEKSGRR